MITARVNIPRSIKKRYYLAFEGERTEPRYFSVLENNRIYNHKVRAVRLRRGPEESHESNPYKLVNLLVDFVDFLHNDRYSVRLFINHVLYYLQQNGIIDKHEPEKEIRRYYSELRAKLLEEDLAADDMILNVEQAEVFAADYFSCVLGIPVPLDLSGYREPFYCQDSEEEFCLIVDRDEKSFTEEQVKLVSDICNEQGYRLIISNPCFELWLLLHFDIPKEVIMAGCYLNGWLKEELDKHS